MVRPKNGSMRVAGISQVARRCGSTIAASSSPPSPFSAVTCPSTQVHLPLLRPARASARPSAARRGSRRGGGSGSRAWPSAAGSASSRARNRRRRRSGCRLPRKVLHPAHGVEDASCPHRPRCPAIGGLFGWNEPPPAAITTTLHSITVPASVVSGSADRRASRAPSTISPRWKVGSNGSICSMQLVDEPLRR